ncbi:MAG: hypothetical protein QOF70_5326, partial [Acetobacteraceae bacterium]|nr:hypothetical protein [Acetobacteraceae bacterium]
KIASPDTGWIALVFPGLPDMAIIRSGRAEIDLCNINTVGKQCRSGDIS